MRTQIHLEDGTSYEIEGAYVQIPGYPYVKLVAHNLYLGPNAINPDVFRLTEPDYGLTRHEWDSPTIDECITKCKEFLDMKKLTPEMWDEVREKGRQRMLAIKALQDEQAVLP